MTGAQLAASDAVSFPTNQPALRGTTLEFHNAADDQVLMRWDLLPPASRGPLRFTIDVNYSPGGHVGDDSDPIFAITDGSRFAGIFRTDNNNSSASTLEGTTTATSVTLGPGASIVTGLGSVQPFTFELSTGPTMIANYEEGTFSTTATFQVPGAPLDPAGPIGLILASGSVSHGEKYRLHSLRVSIEAIPEPSTLALVLLAVALWLGVRRSGAVARLIRWAMPTLLGSARSG
jgi:hypothetical protein